MQDPAERHVLAERHAANLLVSRDLLARGVERDLRIVEAGVAVTFDHARSEGGVELARQGGEVGALWGVADGTFDVDPVLRPDDEVDGSLHAIRRGEEPLEHDPLVGSARVRPLRATALHEGNVHRSRVVASGSNCGGREHDRDQGGTDGQRLPRPFPRSREHDADRDDEDDEQWRAAEPDDERNRRHGLADRERRERHPAERPRPADHLGESDRSRQDDPAPTTRRCERARGTEVRGVDD